MSDDVRRRLLLGGAALLASATAVLAADPAGARCTRSTADRRATASSECLSCHGPPAAPGDGDRSGARATVQPRMFRMPGHEFSHPVDVDLEAVRAARPGSLTRAADLPNDLPLAGGKITCLTCHDGRAGHPYSLARASTRELCLACHRM